MQFRNKPFVEKLFVFIIILMFYLVVHTIKWDVTFFGIRVVVSLGYVGVSLHSFCCVFCATC